MTLKFLEKEDEADNLISRIFNDSVFDSELYDGFKHDIDSLYFNKSKEFIFENMMTDLMKSKIKE